MAHIIEDRVLEQSTTAGLGAFTLAGAALGFRSFASVCSVADTVWYYIEAVDSLGKPSGAYEYGLGTYSGANTLTRTTVRGSSNGGAAVDFAAGNKLVGIGILAPRSNSRNEWRNAMQLVAFAGNSLLNLSQAGAAGDGSTDDSAAVAAAVAARAITTYKFSGVTLSNNQTLDFGNMRASAVAASSYMVRFTNYAPVVKNVYVADASGATAAFLFATDGRLQRLTDTWILNAVTAIQFTPGGASFNVRAVLSNVVVDTFSVAGVDIDPNVSEINAVNVYLDSGIDTVNNYPKRSAIGWRQNTPVGTHAVGGHLLTNVTTINCETGFYFTDAQLTALNNCIADGTAGYAVKLDGACQYMDFNGLFVGTSRGVYVGGTCTGITFSGLTTILTGVIPPWSVNPNFYLALPDFDVTVADTAVVKIEGDSWYGRKQVSVAAGAKLVVTGGERITFDTNGTVAAGSTVYLDDDGVGANEADTIYRAPFDGYLFSSDMFSDGAPVGAETFTYTARVNGVDTALVATTTGAATAAGITYPTTAIFVTKGSSITHKLVTSAGAVARRHQGSLHFLPL